MKVVANFFKSNINGDYHINLTSISELGQGGEDLEFYTKPYKRKANAVKAAKRFAEHHNFDIVRWEGG